MPLEKHLWDYSILAIWKNKHTTFYLSSCLKVSLLTVLNNKNQGSSKWNKDLVNSYLPVCSILYVPQKRRNKIALLGRGGLWGCRELLFLKRKKKNLSCQLEACSCHQSAVSALQNGPMIFSGKLLLKEKRIICTIYNYWPSTAKSFPPHKDFTVLKCFCQHIYTTSLSL